MITLGIETSCDETSSAILENDNRILSNVIASSLAKHKPFGGVVPEIASRHSLEAIDIVYQASLKEARLKAEKIDLIAVTQGPGLIGSLLVGVSFAKALAFALGKPFIGVHHLEAHLASNFILRKKPKKPFIGLIVSGGHTSIVLVKGTVYEELGSTIDDAIGEAYDKVAKILGLGYPGGPVIDRLAQKGNPHVHSFTKPKVDGKFDFSFSGIKTAILHLANQDATARNHRRRSGSAGSPSRAKSRDNLGIGIASVHRNDRRVWRGKKLADLCASFQFAVTDWIIQKTLLACEEKGIKTVAMGGGVSANSRLRSVLSQECRLRGYDFFLPPFELTLDNAAMIARLGFERYKNGIRSNENMSASSSLPFGKN